MKNKVKILLIVFCALFFCGCTAEKAEEVGSYPWRRDVCNYVDPETGVNYLLFIEQGGMTVRYNADGTIMVTEEKTDDK